MLDDMYKPDIELWKLMKICIVKNNTFGNRPFLYIHLQRQLLKKLTDEMEKSIERYRNHKNLSHPRPTQVHHNQSS